MMEREELWVMKMSRLKPFRLWLYRLLTSWLPETRCFGLKVFLLRWAGAIIGKNVRINSSALFGGDGSLVIGDDVWVGAGDVISPVALARIVIGSCVDFGPQVMVITGSHEIDPYGDHIGGNGIAKDVEIGNGCWLGARVTILPGVTVAEKTVIAAGAVVTKSIAERGTLVAGVPAVFKKKLVE